MKIVLTVDDEHLDEQLEALRLSFGYLSQPGSVCAVKIGDRNYSVMRTRDGIEVYATDRAVPNANRYLNERD